MIKVIGNKFFFDGKTYRCAIGKNGFSSDKKEGDGCTPLGVFPLRELWYRADKMSAPITNLPLKIITENDGWCDDVTAPDYNKHILIPSPPERGQGEGAAELISRARALKQSFPTPEIKLWNVLRNRQMSGQKFRRQHPIGSYIADFYCDDKKLIIELEGKSHDVIRSVDLEKEGYKIIRFTNAEIKENFEGVVERVYLHTGEKMPRHEKMWRDDGLYDLVIPMGYNDSLPVLGKGSAIFMHIAKPDYSGTEGCVALSKEDFLEILPQLSSRICLEVLSA